MGVRQRWAVPAFGVAVAAERAQRGDGPGEHRQREPPRLPGPSAGTGGVLDPYLSGAVQPGGVGDVDPEGAARLSERGGLARALLGERVVNLYGHTLSIRRVVHYALRVWERVDGPPGAP